MRILAILIALPLLGACDTIQLAKEKSRDTVASVADKYCAQNPNSRAGFHEEWIGDDRVRVTCE